MNNFLTLQFSSVTQYWVWLSATPWTDQCFQWIFLYHWWFYLLAGQGTLKSLNQRESSKASILWHSAFFVVHLSHPSMATETTIALTRWTFVAKVMSLIFNMLSRFIIPFLPRKKHPLISWLQSPCIVILEAKKRKICHCFYYHRAW